MVLTILFLNHTNWCSNQCIYNIADVAYLNNNCVFVHNFIPNLILMGIHSFIIKKERKQCYFSCLVSQVPLPFCCWKCGFSWYELFSPLPVLSETFWVLKIRNTSRTFLYSPVLKNRSSSVGGGAVEEKHLPLERRWSNDISGLIVQLYFSLCGPELLKGSEPLKKTTPGSH